MARQRCTEAVLFRVLPLLELLQIFLQTAGVGEKQRRGSIGGGGGGRSSTALLKGSRSDARHGLPVHQGDLY